MLLLSGGVDTWKMDSHGICVALAQHLGITVLAFDQPGTGETLVPLTVEADELVLGLVAEARRIGNGKVAHFGISFGADYSAMTGLLGVVDASIVLGGPVDQAFAPESLQKLPYGIRDILGNDMGFDRQPSMPEFISMAEKLARRDLLARSDKRAFACHQRCRRLFRSSGRYARLRKPESVRSTFDSRNRALRFLKASRSHGSCIPLAACKTLTTAQVGAPCAASYLSLDRKCYRKFRSDGDDDDSQICSQN